MNTTLDCKTIGRLVAEFQRPYHEIKAAFDAAGVKPEMVLNGIAYFSTAGIEQMANRLQQR